MKDGGKWNPYVAGGLSGIVAVASVGLVGKYLGASTTFAKTTGMVEQLFSPERVAAMPYFIREIPAIDWQWMFVARILLGAFIAAVTSGSFRLQKVPDRWAARFGPMGKKRALVAMLGGILAMFGARLADGCPSGHGLSGGLQLSVSGYVAVCCFFIGGMISANWLYRGGDR